MLWNENGVERRCVRLDLLVSIILDLLTVVYVDVGALRRLFSIRIREGG